MRIKQLPTYRLCRTSVLSGWGWISDVGRSGTIIALLLLISSCRPGIDTRHIEGNIMGTYYTVTYRSNIDKSVIKPMISDDLSEIEQQLSNWNPDSWISRFNKSPKGTTMSVPSHAYQVLELYGGLNKLAKGGMDPTLGSIITLWGFGPEKVASLPTDMQIQKTMKSTGVKKITLATEPSSITKSVSGLELNVSAVAKGYAVDVVAGKLEEQGITDYLINIGGEIRASGHPENQSAWKVGIQQPDPHARDGQTEVVFQLDNIGLATSGDYRRYHKLKGKSYAHILDPKTGRPIQTKLASVSIIAPTAARADGLATACMVLGMKQATKLITSLPDIEGLFIQRMHSGKFRINSTSGWPKLLHRKAS